MYHFDFYRFKDQTEWLSSGFREYFNADIVCVVEWPERAGDLLCRRRTCEIAARFEGEAQPRTSSAHSRRPGEAWLSSLPSSS